MKKLAVKSIIPEVVGPLEGPLSRAEHSRYEALKEELRKHIDIITASFVRVGAVLRIIRDERLYRVEYSAFEDFCRQEMGTGKRYINRIIQAQGVIEALLEAGEDKITLPSNVRLARELALYPKSSMAKIWQQAKQIALAEGKAKPDSITVKEAAAQLQSSPQAVERATEALIQKIEGIQRALKISIGWEFLQSRQVARLKQALGMIAAQAAALLQSAPPEGLEISLEEDFSEDEEETQDIE